VQAGPAKPTITVQYSRSESVSIEGITALDLDFLAGAGAGDFGGAKKTTTTTTQRASLYRSALGGDPGRQASSLVISPP
jgi:hypothetical protein